MVVVDEDVELVVLVVVEDEVVEPAPKESKVVGRISLPPEGFEHVYNKHQTTRALSLSHIAQTVVVLDQTHNMKRWHHPPSARHWW